MTGAQVATRDLCLVCAILLSWTSTAAAAPSEPPHKAPHRTIPPHASRTAPDVTGTVAKAPAERPPAATPGADDAIPPPFKLPAASRDRVRSCGLAWHDMKIAGQTGDDDWRDFAEKCFVAKDPPPRRP